MKKLTTILEKGNLTPKERILLLVHDYVAKETTGKATLTDADKHSICEAWKPQNGEAEIYNRYNNGWRIEGGLKLDTQTLYLNAQNALLRASRLVDYAMWTDCKNEGGYFKKIDIEVNHDEAVGLIIKNSGLEFDQVVYQLTFQSLTEVVRADILKLCPDAETESQYLDQEEILTELFNGNKKLTVEAKERLTDLILGVMKNRHADILEEKGIKHEKWWFSGYFAELPTIEIVKKWTEYNSMSKESDDNLLIQKIKEYAETQKIDAGELLKQTILRWLDEGLFVNEYEPIWSSNNKSTCNDADTKLPHKEILKRWLKTKTEAKATIQKLTSSGQLRIETKEQDFYGVKEKVRILTGESLYNLQGDFTFVADYKKQADNLSSLASLILFLRNRDFLKNYASLLAVADIYKKLSKIYEIDMGYKINEFINGFMVSIGQLNNELRYIADKLEESIHTANNIKFSAEVFLDDILIHLEDVKPIMSEMETHYLEEFQKILGSEF